MVTMEYIQYNENRLQEIPMSELPFTMGFIPFVSDLKCYMGCCGCYYVNSQLPTRLYPVKALFGHQMFTNDHHLLSF